MVGLNSRKVLPLFGFIGLIVIFLAACGSSSTATPTSTPSPTSTSTPTPQVPEKDGEDAIAGELPDQIFAAHFVDSSPKHGDVFALAPQKVVINFNFTLHDNSSITVTKNGAPVQTDPIVIDDTRLSMSVSLPSTTGDGLYVVDYMACWPDGSCHDGRSAFSVDSSVKASYLDMRGKAEVQIDMKDTSFQPASIIISKGTKVVWTNQEAVTHFVNTDPHLSHNALPALNSLEINQGESYSFTFNEAGEKHYHCSAHYPQGMVARIIVE